MRFKTEQRKIWDSFTLKRVNRVALWNATLPKVRNGQQKGGEFPEGHFMVCVNVASEITLNLFFFFPQTLSASTCETCNSTKILQHREKGKFLFLRRTASSPTIGYLLLLFCKTLQRPDYDHHGKWNVTLSHWIAHTCGFQTILCWQCSSRNAASNEWKWCMYDWIKVGVIWNQT